MKNYIGRRRDLKKKINQHLTKLTGKEADYFSRLRQSDLLELKTVLTDINNVLTLRMTIKAVKSICEQFHFERNITGSIIKEIDQIKPNTQGFDITLEKPVKLLVEVKCVIPVNNGNQFGAAQWNGILDDAIKLKFGKGKFSDTTEYFKFLFLIDVGKRTDLAVAKLLKESRSTCENPVRINRHEVKRHIELFDNNSSVDLNKDKIYVVKIK